MNNADLVAEHGEYMYTCPECGSHALRVEKEYVVTTYYRDELPCDCGESENGLAAVREYHIVVAWRETGWLDADHQTLPDDQERQDVETVEDDSEVFCDCAEGADPDDWQTEEDPSAPEEEDQDPVIYVRCGGCCREIEFGWSHPDRGGRIWPAECSDHNPYLSWPEPRYRERWREKGWLRPDRGVFL